MSTKDRSKLTESAIKIEYILFDGAIMGWTYDKNLSGSTSLKALPIGLVVLAILVFLLWLGNVRSSDTVSADSSNTSLECMYVPSGGCEGIALGVRPIVQPMPESSGYAFGEEGAEEARLQGIPAPGNSGEARGVISNQFCVSLRPCRESSGYGYSGEEVAGMSVLGIPTSGNGSHGSGEQTVASNCLLGTPCWLSEGGVNGEERVEGRTFSINLPLQNADFVYR